MTLGGATRAPARRSWALRLGGVSPVGAADSEQCVNAITGIEIPYGNYKRDRVGRIAQDAG